MLDVLSALSDDRLRRAFGADTLARAHAYAVDHAVDQLAVLNADPLSFEARATVQGTRRKPYFTRVVLDATHYRAEVYSICTCPVGGQCKHGAAVALVARAALDRGRSSAWEREVSDLLDELDTLVPEGAADQPIALELRLAPPPHGRWSPTGAADQLWLRPMRPGARGGWIKSGARWHELLAARTQRLYEPEQLQAVCDLQSAVVQASNPWAVQVDTVAIDDFGPDVWRLLRAARDAGVTLVCDGSLGQLEILDEPLVVEADLVADHGGTGLRLAIPYAGRLWSGDRIVAVGQPAHGVLLLTPRDGPTGRATNHDAVLAALVRPAPASTMRLLRQAEPVAVPTEAAATFRSQFLPRLQRRFTVVSSDGSVEIPDVPLPRLLCTVTWCSSSRAGLAWSWAYLGGDDTQRFPLEEHPLTASLRDPSAEGRLLARLLDEVDLEGITLVNGRPARQTVSGDDVLRLSGDVLPRLRAHELITVEEHDAPDHRAAEGAPQVSFEALDDVARPGDAPAGDAPAEDDGGEEPGSTDWLDLSVVIRVDDEQVALVDVLTALTTEQERLILPSGLHVATDRPEFQQLRDLVLAAAELREVEGDRIGVGAHDLGIWAQLADLGIVDQQAAEWVRRAQALRDLTDLPAPDPVGVVSTLRHYQLDGFRWLAFLWESGLGGILADDMGLGKTLQVLALISHARTHGAEVFLVVAPTSVVYAWRAEAERHTPGLVVRTVTASEARRGESVAEVAAGADVVVTTYTLLRLEQDDYAGVAWGGLVLDEAQQVKNHRGKTYGAVRRLPVPFRLAVTGTPFENRLLELWSLLSITVPGLYPWPKAFTDNVVRPVEKSGDQAALRRFRQRIRPFLLRRTKELVAADLPPKQEQVLAVELSPRHRRIYDTHLAKERQKVLGLVGDFERNRVAIFTAITRLRQLALAPGLVAEEHDAVGSAKLDVLVEHLTEIIAEGHRVLVFSQFTRFLALVRARLDAEGIATSYLDGSTRNRASVIEGFKSGADPVFLISLKAGGVGLTLTEADYVFVLDPWWNPATEAQAVDRVHRIGQERPVLVYRLVATDTIEEKVMELKARKAELFAQVLEGEGALGTAIGADDIRRLFDSGSG